MNKKTALTISLTLFFTIPVVVLAQLPDPLRYKTFPELIGAAASFVFTLIIPISIIAVVWSGVSFITSGGNEERIKKARAWLLWALIGLAVGLIGVGFVRVVLEAMGS
jgi:cytochrome c biogenesis factor